MDVLLRNIFKSCKQPNGKEIIISKTEDLSNNILLDEDFWWEGEALSRFW